MMMSFLMRVLTFLMMMSSFCVLTSAAAEETTTTYDVRDGAGGEYDAGITTSGELSQAVDAAIAELMGTKGWFHDLRNTTGYKHALEVVTCTPDKNMWLYPPEKTATGSLKRVLTTGKLVVAGVKWSAPGAADYRTNPDAPTGFWPKYLEAIVDKISKAYKKNIRVVRIYYQTSGVVVDKVQAGVVDMSEPYYYISGFVNNKPRIEALDYSCITAATEGAFYVRKDKNMNTFDDLYEKLVAGPLHTVGFIGQGNYDSMSDKLPSSAVPYIPNDNPDSSALNQRVIDNLDLAVYVSEFNPGADVTDLLMAIPTGVVSPRVILFPQQGAEAKSVDESKTRNSDDKSGGGIIVGLVIVACVALLLGVLLTFVVVRERKGAPIFMPLLDSVSTNKAFHGEGGL